MGIVITHSETSENTTRSTNLELVFDFVFVLSLRLGLTTWFTPIVNHKRTGNLLDSGKNQEESKETTGLPQIKSETKLKIGVRKRHLGEFQVPRKLRHQEKIRQETKVSQIVINKEVSNRI